MRDQHYENMYHLAAERFEESGVDCRAAMERLGQIAVSLHCWQGDDVAGFEPRSTELGGGLAVTGNYPGRATNVDQLRQDLEMAFRLLPGRHRLNLHASYGEFGGRLIERNQITTQQFQGWIDWAKESQLGLDFNSTYFAHPLAVSGWTLAHQDSGIRQFWIEHGIACRQIAADIGRALQTPCINNLWIPDGCKETPVDRRAPRERLVASLDTIYRHAFSEDEVRDAVEAKLFGIGSESYVVGSHEFYLGYAISRNKLLCLDAGHFHPTETISDKISSTLLWVKELLLHVSRGVRWDSDHVVVLNDELAAIAQELVRGNYLDRVHIGLDFFDASINRVAAWVIGTRSLLKALLAAMLEPIDAWRNLESSGDTTARLALLEEQKSLPVGAVWDYYCLQNSVPIGQQWLDQVRQYEREVLSKR